MTDDSDRFRKRACECRELAKDARDQQSRDELSAIAKDLEEEADEIDDEQVAS